MRLAVSSALAAVFLASPLASAQQSPPASSSPTVTPPTVTPVSVTPPTTTPPSVTPPTVTTPLPQVPPPQLPVPPEPLPPREQAPPVEQVPPVPPKTDEKDVVSDAEQKPLQDAKPADTAATEPVVAPPLKPDLSNARTGFLGMVRAQVLMDRAWVSPGEIDGTSGDRTTRAIGGFQRLSKLPVTGRLDNATWEALEKRGPALTKYVLTAADIAGPYRAIPSSMYGKAKLPALDYNNIYEALGERFHISPTALKRLNPDKNFAVAGTEIMVPNVRDIPQIPQATRIVVSEAAKLLMLINGEGRVYAQFPVTTGSELDPLPIGEWEVRSVARNPHYNYNPKLFKRAKPGPKASLPPGPNSPVGVMWMGLSKPHYGIHGTPEPGQISKTASNGCIRMTNWSVLQVSKAVGNGTPVTLIP